MISCCDHTHSMIRESIIMLLVGLGLLGRPRFRLPLPLVAPPLLLLLLPLEVVVLLVCVCFVLLLLRCANHSHPKTWTSLIQTYMIKRTGKGEREESCHSHGGLSSNMANSTHPPHAISTASHER